jgi:hypothetical protein
MAGGETLGALFCVTLFFPSREEQEVRIGVGSTGISAVAWDGEMMSIDYRELSPGETQDLTPVLMWVCQKLGVLPSESVAVARPILHLVNLVGNIVASGY